MYPKGEVSQKVAAPHGTGAATGHADLVICYKNDIVIENKIKEAGAQNTQLYRYLGSATTIWIGYARPTERKISFR